jgi:hypothetical protein
MTDRVLCRLIFTIYFCIVAYLVLVLLGYISLFPLGPASPGANSISIVLLIVTFLIAISLTVAIFIKVRSYHQFVLSHPDKAYNWFTNNEQLWIIFLTADLELIKDNLHKPKSWNKLLGPIQFTVPQLQNRTITVYGKSTESIGSIQEFIRTVKTRV